MGSEIADKSLAARRAFSEEVERAGCALINCSVICNAGDVGLLLGDVTSARRTRRSKRSFRIYLIADTHMRMSTACTSRTCNIENQLAPFGAAGRYETS